MFESPVLMLARKGDSVFQVFVSTSKAAQLAADLEAAGFHGRNEFGAIRAGDLEEEVSIIYLDYCNKTALNRWLREWAKQASNT